MSSIISRDMIYSTYRGGNTPVKRVWGLYRVSTDRQGTGDDIPMQRNASREFVSRKSDWVLERELIEMGVSGFKKSAKDRDAIESLRKAAINKEFDVVLVFMYDRLGRKHEETPFIVEWFVKQGIEVWSVMEGQRTFDNHVDSLTNYITFWQASGESIKTSQRVTEAISQLNEEGGYTGGSAPYGYEIYDTGVKHPKKDKNIKDVRINKEEATVVKIVFNLALTKGFGTIRIAGWLNENGYKTRKGSEWKSNYISRILGNPIVTGYKRYGVYSEGGSANWDQMKLQPYREEWEIVTKSDFNQVRKMLDSRNNRKPNDAESKIPTKSQLLLSGVAKCGYCGGNLSSDYSYKKYKKNDGSETISVVKRYTCKRGKTSADKVNHESIMFGAKKYESEVERLVKQFIEEAKKDDFIEEMNKFQEENVKKRAILLEKTKRDMQTDYQELSAIKGLIVKVELGQSRLSFETVESMLVDQENKITEKNLLITSLENELNDEKLKLSQYEQVLIDFDNWVEKYEQQDIDSKKMMLSIIIGDLSFKKDEISIDLLIPLAKPNTSTNYVANNQSNSISNRLGNTPPSEYNMSGSKRCRWPRLHNQL
ncbi:recombinase family protein [Paenibacillus sp. M2]|uniref:recombinase family protein n=1 Tax=Paenibacillus sp. M2 TaxID=3341793 RepID=UPI003988F3E9